MIKDLLHLFSKAFLKEKSGYLELIIDIILLTCTNAFKALLIFPKAYSATPNLYQA